jgi:Ca2+-binding EF-hand superfamily protein
MTLDAYKTVNKSVKVDKDDLSCLLEVLDADKDGKVTIYDLERLVEKYLSGVN